MSESLQPEFFAHLPVQQLELGKHHVSLLTPELETVLLDLYGVVFFGLAILAYRTEEHHSFG